MSSCSVLVCILPCLVEWNTLLGRKDKEPRNWRGFWGRATYFTLQVLKYGKHSSMQESS